MNILCLCLSATIQRTLSFESFSKEKVNRSSDFIENASGKAVNTARILNQLEKDCATVLCPVGKANKDRFLELAQKDNLKVTSIEIEGNTRECWTLVEKSGSTTEVVADEKFSGSQKDMAENSELLLKTLEKELTKADGLIFAGSCPSCFEKSLPEKICRMAEEKHIPLLVDFWGLNLLNSLKVSTPQIIKINEDEYLGTWSKQPSKESLIEGSLQNNNIIVVTRGTASTMAGVCGKYFECPSKKVKTVNTTACGDSFNAGFMLEYLKSGDIQAALELGTECAARNAASLIPGSLV